MFIAFMNFSIQTHQHQHQKEIPDSRSVFQMALCLCEKSFTEAQPIKIERNWMHTRMEYFCQCFLSVNNTKKRNRQKYLQNLLRSSNQGSPGNCSLTQIIVRICILCILIRELSKQLDFFLQVNSEGHLSALQ